MGVYATEGAVCSTSTLTALQEQLEGAGNAFCFLGMYTAVNLPSTFDVSSIGVTLKKLDIDETSAGAEWDGQSVTLIIFAALCAAAAVYLLARHLFVLPSFLKEL